MNELTLRNELIGGPNDGDSWSSDWVPHWRQEIACARRGSEGTYLWAEYQLKTSKLEYHEGKACVHFQFQFVGFRESFPTWTVWVTAKLRRFARSCIRRLVRPFKKGTQCDHLDSAECCREPVE